MSTPYTPANTWLPQITVFENGDTADAPTMNAPIKQLADRTEALNQVAAIIGPHSSLPGGTLDTVIGQLVGMQNAALRQQMRFAWNVQAPVPRDLYSIGGSQPTSFAANLSLADAEYGVNNALFALFNNGKIAASTNGLGWTSITPGGSYTGTWNGGIYAHGRTVIYGTGGEIHTLDPTASSSDRRKTGGADINSLCNNLSNDRLVALAADGHVWTDNGTINTWSDLGLKFGAGPTTGLLVAGKTTGEANCILACWHDPANMNVIHLSTDNGATWGGWTVDTDSTVWVMRVLYTTIGSGRRWVAVAIKGDTTRIYTSNDAKLWTMAADLGRGVTYYGHAVPLPGAVLLLSELQCVYFNGTEVVGLAPLNGIRALLNPALYVSLAPLNVSYVLWASETQVQAAVWPD